MKTKAVEVTSQTVGLRGFSFQELKRQNAHAHEVASVNSLEGLSDHSLDPLQIRAPETQRAPTPLPRYAALHAVLAFLNTPRGRSVLFFPSLCNTSGDNAFLLLSVQQWRQTVCLQR